MAKSAFWRDLEQRFRELQANCVDSLEACWMASGSGTDDYQWRLRESTESARKMFIWLADRAAVELGHKAGTGWSHWLDLLKRDSPNHRDIALQGFDKEGADVKTGAGTILRLCGASAQYCIYCEGFMISKRRRKSETQMMPAAGVTQISSLVLGVSSGREKPGAKADLERASRVAEIVPKIAPDRRWKNHWEDLCEDFDRAQIPIPRAWKNDGLRSWLDCDDRERVVKAIMYQLTLAKKKIVILA
jgi:hypothetical protein